MTAILELQAYAGDDIQQAITVTQVGGGAFNLTGSVLYAGLTANPAQPDADAVWLGGTEATGITITNALQGQALLDIPGSATAGQLSNATLYLFVRLKDGGGKITTIVAGSVSFLAATPQTLA